MNDFEKGLPELSDSDSDFDSDATSSVAGGDGNLSDNDIDVFDGGANSDTEGEEEEENEDSGSVRELENAKEAEIRREFGEGLGEETSSDTEDEEEEDDDGDENYLQKMDEHVRSKVIENFHPELKTLNYEEVEALATVIRGATGVIIDPLHQTLPFLSRYEKARILGERARQINGGAKPMVEVDPTIIDGYLIALKELEEKRIPFIIQRPLPNGGSEYWRVADLEIL
jgi:DNA-directed RNA polymerase I, II, and III subunit RPABC2